MSNTAQWDRTAPGRYEWQGPSGRIYQVIRRDWHGHTDWDVATSDGALSGRGFESLKRAKAYCETWEG